MTSTNPTVFESDDASSSESDDDIITASTTTAGILVHSSVMSHDFDLNSSCYSYIHV